MRWPLMLLLLGLVASCGQQGPLMLPGEMLPGEMLPKETLPEGREQQSLHSPSTGPAGHRA